MVVVAASNTATTFVNKSAGDVADDQRLCPLPRYWYIYSRSLTIEIAKTQTRRKNVMDSESNSPLGGELDKRMTRTIFQSRHKISTFLNHCDNSPSYFGGK
jgi:hypothetical protein